VYKGSAASFVVTGEFLKQSPMKFVPDFIVSTAMNASGRRKIVLEGDRCNGLRFEMIRNHSGKIIEECVRYSCNCDDYGKHILYSVLCKMYRLMFFDAYFILESFTFTSTPSSPKIVVEGVSSRKTSVKRTGEKLF